MKLYVMYISYHTVQTKLVETIGLHNFNKKITNKKSPHRKYYNVEIVGSNKEFSQM